VKERKKLQKLKREARLIRLSDGCLGSPPTTIIRFWVDDFQQCTLHPIFDNVTTSGSKF
jgi:hypothetical protein